MEKGQAAIFKYEAKLLISLYPMQYTQGTFIDAHTT